MHRGRKSYFSAYGPSPGRQWCLGARVAVPATRFARGLLVRLLPLLERAQGKPGAGCTRRSRAPKAHGHPVRRSTRVNTTGTARTSRLSPRKGLAAYFVLSPVSGVCCHRCRARTGRPDRRHGRGARTTRLRRRSFRHGPHGPTGRASFANDARRPSHPAPNVTWRWRYAPLTGAGRVASTVKQNSCKRNYFQRRA